LNHETLQAIREQAKKDIWLVGGGELVASFLRLNAIDELWITQLPLLLGEGLPLFPSTFPETHFVLQDLTPYENGVINLRYTKK
jgi:dihydrofolate reductase